MMSKTIVLVTYIKHTEAFSQEYCVTDALFFHYGKK